MQTSKIVLAACLPLAALMLSAAAPQRKTVSKPPVKTKSASTNEQSSRDALFRKEVLPLVIKYCVGCHTGPSGSGGIDLSSDKNLAAVFKNRRTWEKAILNTSEKRMPPSGMPMPTQAERDKMTQMLDAAFVAADCQLNDPGRVTMRRLNRSEYNNTIRDLLLVEARPADEFPNDDVGYGFDNIGDVLTISPLLMEKFLSAAEKVAKQAVVAPEDQGSRPFRFLGSSFKGDGAAQDGSWMLASNGKAGIEFDFPAAGEYKIVVNASAQQAGREPARMGIDVGEENLKTINVTTREGQPMPYRASILVSAPGKRRITAAFLNDYYDADNKDEKLRGDRNLIVESIEVQMPPEIAAAVYRRSLPVSHRSVMIDRPDNDTDGEWNRASRAVFAPLLKRAFRRPPTTDELSRVVRVVHLAKEKKQSFERGVQLGLQAVLVSPNFLFRPEPDARPDDPNARRALNDYELASRLSYFIWSSMPDDTLLSLAAQGKLKDPTVLVAQAKRMLLDPKAKALADNFAGQWLNLRKIGVVQPDTARFPGFSEELRAAMRGETEHFFNGIVSEDRSVLEFLDSDYTYLNEPLAKFYGNTTVKGNEFQRVKLVGGTRGGLLGQASILTLTSNPGRTSPVKRGKWVMENLLGTPPPPPPPNVPALDKPGEPIVAETVRKRLEIHRKNPACAGCHAAMDGIGFALENFNGVGGWRTEEFGKPLDVAGTLPDGSSFNGPKELRALLMKKKPQFTRAITERMLTYALGRGVESSDRCNLDTMAKSVAAKNYRFSAVVEAVVLSKPFRERRGDESSRKTASL